MWLTRTGYTGEDGFEISLKKTDTVALTKKLLENPDARMSGLGARDSLRLEAGLCLYGNDLNEDIGPIEAGLTWTIGKSRREKCDFVGGDVIKAQLEAPASVTKRRASASRLAKARPRERVQDPLIRRRRGGRGHQRRILARAPGKHRHGVRAQVPRQGGHRAAGGDARKEERGGRDQDALRHLPLPPPGVSVWALLS